MTQSTVESGERDALIALSLRRGTGISTLIRLRRRHGSFSAALANLAGGSGLACELHAQCALLLRQVAGAGAQVITCIDGLYPRKLQDLEDPPPFIICRGSLDVLSFPVVAIVGTRTATRYGERIASEFAGALASAGVCIASGLARGIDAAAHQGALEAGGATCAVLGTGIDQVYPASHVSLQRTIGNKGLILTESLPGARPSPGSFPRRNRLIAAMSRATIVIEAGRRSGALLTAGHALRLGRQVAAVPGRIDSLQSQGSNLLLTNGAIVLASVDDAYVLAGVTRSSVATPRREMSAAEEAVVIALQGRTLTSQQVVVASGLPVIDCLTAISSLEVDGLVESDITGELRLAPRRGCGVVTEEQM
jgi:DNA processing protein